MTCLVVAPPTNQTGPFILPEMNFLERGENSWLSPAVATSPERTCAPRGVKASRWTRQEAVEEAEPPGLGEGEAKVSYGGGDSRNSRVGPDLRSLHHMELDRSHLVASVGLPTREAITAAKAGPQCSRFGKMGESCCLLGRRGSTTSGCPRAADR